MAASVSTLGANEYDNLYLGLNDESPAFLRAVAEHYRGFALERDYLLVNKRLEEIVHGSLYESRTFSQLQGEMHRFNSAINGLRSYIQKQLNRSVGEPSRDESSDRTYARVASFAALLNSGELGQRVYVLQADIGPLNIQGIENEKLRFSAYDHISWQTLVVACREDGEVFLPESHTHLPTNGEDWSRQHEKVTSWRHVGHALDEDIGIKLKKAVDEVYPAFSDEQRDEFLLDLAKSLGLPKEQALNLPRYNIEVIPDGPQARNNRFGRIRERLAAAFTPKARS